MRFSPADSCATAQSAFARLLPQARLLGCIGLLAALAACAGQGPQVSATQEAAQYAAHARSNYAPPGPPSDPWGPYIIEAASKYDVPERWVREVIRAESGGRLYEHGTLITSGAGAMGLMQVMPGTYDELRARYGLDDDPYDPHNNILAGTAYVRELYDIYGTPGFLAAYNAGPGRLDDYLTRNRPLPDETRHYVAKIGPYIADSQPSRVSPASQFAMNQLPIDIPAGPRYPRSRSGAPVALADNRGRNGSAATGWSRGTVETAALPEPPRFTPPPVQTYASAAPSQQQRGGFHLISPAMAEPIPMRRGGSTAGNWAIQVGAFGNQAQARTAAEMARSQAHDMLGNAKPTVGMVRQASATLYRARLVGLSRDAAVQACEKLSHGRNSCLVVSPDSQS